MNQVLTQNRENSLYFEILLKSFGHEKAESIWKTRGKIPEVTLLTKKDLGKRAPRRYWSRKKKPQTV